MSAGRQSKWGGAILFFGIIVIGILYGGFCYWSIIQNSPLFAQNPVALILYGAGCILVFVFNVFGILATLSVTRKYTPEFIEKAVQAKQIEYTGKVPRIVKNKKNSESRIGLPKTL